MRKEPSIGSIRPMTPYDEPASAQPLRHRAPRSVRAMALERVREGERPSDVIASYGFHRCTIYGWLKDARERGDDPLAKTATGLDASDAKELSGAQERQLLRWINGKSPLHYGFGHGLWTSELVGELVARRGGQQVPIASVEAMLARLGLLPPTSLKSGLQGEVAHARWLRTQYPAIARKAKREQAELYVWRELPRAPAPAAGRGGRHETPASRQGSRTVVVSGVKGEAFWFTTYTGALTGRMAVELLRRLMYRRARPLHLVLDGQPAHRSLIVESYAASLGGKLCLHRLPLAASAHAADNMGETWHSDVHASEYLGES